ncbi:MAG: hypothetical protein H6Q08_1661 [Acidobacteria bacterium]|nr:hypothetical protein [Acidobacteriota bacterium]
MMPQQTWLRRWVTRALVASACLSLAACSRSPAEQQISDAQAAAARLQRSTAMLQRKIELAASKDFYLLLDPAAPELALMLRGAELQRYPVLGLMLGRPRVAWIQRGGHRPWRGVVWSGGNLEPPRPVLRVVQQDGGPSQEGEEPTAPPVPPTAEERYPVPSRYLIRFDDGLSVEIRPREADAAAGTWARWRTWWGAKWRDVVTAMRPRNRDALRLRVVLNPRDAESLYRALPPDVRLLVLDR